MDGAQVVDKTSMSLDDIIKMDRKNNRKRAPKKNNFAAKNSLNRAKRNIANKNNVGNFNNNRLGLAQKRNMIRNNLLTNKRNNVHSRVNASTIPFNQRQNKTQKAGLQSFKSNNFSMNNAKRIQVTTSNDQHAKFGQNNLRRRQFPRNGNIAPLNNATATFVRRPLRSNTFNGQFNNNQRTFVPQNRFVRSARVEQQTINSYTQPNYGRRSFNQAGNIRGGFGNSNFRRNTGGGRPSFPVNNRSFSGQNTSAGQFNPPGNNFSKPNLRSKDREYEAMAKALIEARRNQSRFNSRGNVYRR